MGRQSSIKKLSPEVRAYIEKLLREDKYTLDEILAWVRQKYPTETAPSRSSIGRYRQQFDELAERMKSMQAASRVLVSELGEDVDDKLGGLLVQAITTVAAHAALDAQTGLDDDDEKSKKLSIKEIGELARAARSVMEARKMSLHERQEIRRLAREELIAEQQTKLNELGQTGEVAPEILNKVIKAAYGL